MRLSFRLGDFLAHILPLGSPRFLNPFLCLVELVRLIVRPVTLAVRLMANMRTGHILIGLLGIRAINSSSLMVFPLVFLVGIFYCMFEIVVCIVQGYIFILLPILYADEHPSKSLAVCKRSCVFDFVIGYFKNFNKR